MRQLLLLAVIFVLLVTPSAAQDVRHNVKDSNQQLKLNKSDKQIIILSILNRTAFGERNLRVSEQSDTAYISTENLPESLVKGFQTIKRIKIIFISPVGLEKKAKNDFDYIEFSEFEVKKNKVLISIFYFYADTNSSSLSYEFRKIKGQWKGKLIGWSATAS